MCPAGQFRVKFGTYKLNVLTWLELLLIMYDFFSYAYIQIFFNPRGFNKGRSSKLREGSQVQQTPEEGRWTYRPKRWGNNNKDEDNSPKTLNDKNQQATSQKFRQQTPEEGRRTYRPKRCGNNNKDEDNSPKTLNDKNQQATSQKFRQQTPEEGRRTYRPKRCGNNNKDEDNSPKTLNDKNQQASSQNFRQR